MTAEPEWFKSSFSGSGNDCVEVARDGDEVLLRNSRDRAAPAHRFTAREWVAFILGAKAGEFDVFDLALD
ncbi:DUF397 domain-containing protein [Microtetraspora malaysiensis]|uniref:DUF397 domain-containing protein n=1 Tax=Microtetraspora malaysiensis TaxID=161358 RepID=UPI003D8F48E1